MTDHIPPEAVEAACIAWAQAGGVTYSTVGEPFKESWRRSARAALTAAYAVLREGIAAEVLAELLTDDLKRALVLLPECGHELPVSPDYGHGRCRRQVGHDPKHTTRPQHSRWQDKPDGQAAREAISYIAALSTAKEASE